MLDLFSYDLLKKRKKRTITTFPKAAYLAQDIEKKLISRLPELSNNLKNILIVGCPAGVIYSHLKGISYDTFDPFLEEDFKEAPLPFQTNHYDLIIEGFVFHWLNDPLKYLTEINRLLRPGGLYLSGFLGGTTLTEMRQALLKTDIDLYQGAFARVSPMIKPEAATRLLQAAKLTNPIVDHEEIGVFYPNIKTVIKDLRFMGESNALNDQRSPKISKGYIDCAEKNYQQLFPKKNKEIMVTFDFVMMTGWCSL